MDIQEKINRNRQILQDFCTDLFDRNSKLLEKNTEWASAIEERSLTFSQFLFSFLFSIGAALVTLFFTVPNLNDLILNHGVFNWAVWIYFISLIWFVFYFKERLDADSAGLVEGQKQSDEDFNAGMTVLKKQLDRGVDDMEIFHQGIQKLSDDNKTKKDASEKESKNFADYYLELFMSLLLISFWLLFFSTQNWCSLYLFLGILVIVYLVNNQNRYFYRLVRVYSRFMYKVFPTK